MTATYTWNFVRLHTADDPRPGTVVAVDWELTLERDPDRVSTYGRVDLPSPDLEQFVEFDDLSQDQVESWVRANLGCGVGRNSRTYPEILNSLDRQMAALRSGSMSERQPPWPIE